MSDEASTGGAELPSVTSELEPPAALRGAFGRMFSSLRHRNYRLFFIGQIISLIGSWIQAPALAWLVWELTGSTVMLGLLSAVSSFPTVVLALPGGLVADHFDRRRILYITQTLLMIVPLALAVLMIVNPQAVQPWQLYAMAAITGMVMSFDMPARQAFVVQMVGRADLPNAIALNSSIFNVARAIGPAIYAVLMVYGGAALIWCGFNGRFGGPATCFAVNGLSFLALVAALFRMRLPSVTQRPGGQGAGARHPLGGLYYVWGTPPLRAAFLLLAANSILAWSFLAMLPAFTTDVYGREVGTFGWFLTIFGAGAFLGALILAYRGRPQTLRRTVLRGLALFTAGAALFCCLDNYLLAAIPLFFAGTGLMNCNAGLNSYVQMFVNERFRGRVMGVYAIFFMGMMPVGSLTVGWLAHDVLRGPPFGLSAGAALRVAVLASLALLAACTLLIGLYWRRTDDGHVSPPARRAS